MNHAEIKIASRLSEIILEEFQDFRLEEISGALSFMAALYLPGKKSATGEKSDIKFEGRN